MKAPMTPEEIARGLSEAQRLALLAFDPVVPVFRAVERPSYNLLCQLRRRGLAICQRFDGSYRGIFGWRWRMSSKGEDIRRILEQDNAG